MGMTMVMLGAAAEGKNRGVTGNSLWPATVIESQAAKNFKLGEPSSWRKADILADCVVKLAQEDDAFTGHMLIDDEYLRSRHGYVDKDFVKYRVNPDIEPSRVLTMSDATWAANIQRGDVKNLDADMQICNE